MVSVFNPTEFSFFLIGIMAQRGSYLKKMPKIKEDRAAEQRVVGEGPAPDATPFPHQALPPPDSEKRKRKEKKEKSKSKDKKASSSQPSPKRSRLSVPDTSKDPDESDRGLIGPLFAPDMSFAKGTSVVLSSAEKKAFTGCSTIELVNTCLEMHSRSLDLTKVIRAHVLKGGVVELAKIKEELSATTTSLKEARDVNAASGESLKTAKLRLRKAEQERDALWAYSEGVKKTNEKLLEDVRELEQPLSEATLVHDKAVSEKARVGIELNDLKDYVIDLHKEAFGQAVRQAIFLYGIPEQNDLDPDKDVFDGRLIPIKDIPTIAEDSTPGIDKDETVPPEGGGNADAADEED